ncbi:hypothetical protein B0T14DRAFT_337001 [Immersiella caudata]|uniref:Uncharacterized protein n=1 Tax=Immersiella caudata TaxID=314043 RepID=A0AA39THU0_9PEZI|nr:hypothetical protein B0T14DRAFT_337001 [Immersiella caudata]
MAWWWQFASLTRPVFPGLGRRGGAKTRPVPPLDRQPFWRRSAAIYIFSCHGRCNEAATSESSSVHGRMYSTWLSDIINWASTRHIQGSLPCLRCRRWRLPHHEPARRSPNTEHGAQWIFQADPMTGNPAIVGKTQHKRQAETNSNDAQSQVRTFRFRGHGSALYRLGPFVLEALFHDGFSLFSRTPSFFRSGCVALWVSPSKAPVASCHTLLPSTCLVACSAPLEKQRRLPFAILSRMLCKSLPIPSCCPGTGCGMRSQTTKFAAPFATLPFGVAERPSHCQNSIMTGGTSVADPSGPGSCAAARVTPFSRSDGHTSAPRCKKTTSKG